VRRATEPKRVGVVLHLLRVDTGLLDPLDEEFRVVNTLSSREDLLTAHEEVVRVGEFLHIHKLVSRAERGEGERRRVRRTGSEGSGIV
jgi:hypothetical protein